MVKLQFVVEQHKCMPARELLKMLEHALDKMPNSPLRDRDDRGDDGVMSITVRYVPRTGKCHAFVESFSACSFKLCEETR